MKYRNFTIPVIYLILGLLWIWLSDDLLLSQIAADQYFSSGDIVTFSKTKGFLFIVVTAIALFFLIKRNTNSLREIKNDFKRLFDENPNPMWIYQLQNQQIVLVNDAACNLYGYTKEDFLKLNLYDLRPESEYEKLLNNISNSQKGYANSKEWIHQNKSGERFYVNIFSNDTTYQGKKCRIVTAININEKKIIELDRHNIRNAINHAALVSVTDIDENIIEVNEKFCEIFKYERDELIGKNHSLVAAPHYGNEFWVKMKGAIFEGKSWRAEIKSKAKDGAYHWIDVSASPVIDQNGNVYKIIFIGYEINARKQLEEKLLIQNKRLEEIAWQQAHQVRRPVANILGLCNLIRDDSDASEAEHQQYLDYLYKSAQELDDVIHQIMANTDRI